MELNWNYPVPVFACRLKLVTTCYKTIIQRPVKWRKTYPWCGCDLPCRLGSASCLAAALAFEFDFFAFSWGCFCWSDFFLAAGGGDMKNGRSSGPSSFTLLSPSALGVWWEKRIQLINQLINSVNAISDQKPYTGMALVHCNSYSLL